jgi:hypothetical protein
MSHILALIKRYTPTKTSLYLLNKMGEFTFFKSFVLKWMYKILFRKNNAETTDHSGPEAPLRQPLMTQLRQRYNVNAFIAQSTWILYMYILKSFSHYKSYGWVSERDAFN